MYIIHRCFGLATGEAENTGSIQATLLTALKEYSDATKNKFHIDLVDNDVSFTLPEGEITQSELVHTFDELSDYFKLETRMKVNKHLDEDPLNPSYGYAWLWRFTSEDLTSFLIDLLVQDTEALAAVETLSSLEKESIFSFGLVQGTDYYCCEETVSYIGLWLGDPTYQLPIKFPLELNTWYAIEVSQIKVIITKVTCLTLSFFSL